MLASAARRAALWALPMLASPALSAEVVAPIVPAYAAPTLPRASVQSAIADLQMRDQDGRALTLGSLRGQIVLLNFFFTGCSTICPQQTSQLVDVQQRLPAALRGRVHFLSVSIDAVNDDPVLLRLFATAHGADLGDWSFVTLDAASLARFVAAFGARRSVGDDLLRHSTDLRLLDPSLQVVQRYAGAPVDVPRLAREIAQLAALRANR